VITPKRAIPFLEELPVEDYYGIGDENRSKISIKMVFIRGRI